MLGNMGITEWAILLVIILIFFGPKNLPKLAQSIGKSVRELKNGLNGLGDELKETITSPPEPPAKTQTKSESVVSHEDTSKEDESQTTL